MIRLTSQVVEFGKATFSVRKEIEIKQDHFFLLGGGIFVKNQKRTRSSRTNENTSI